MCELFLVRFKFCMSLLSITDDRPSPQTKLPLKKPAIALPYRSDSFNGGRDYKGFSISVLHGCLWQDRGNRRV